MPMTPKLAACAAVLLMLVVSGCGKDDAKASTKTTPSSSASQLLPGGGPSTSSASPATGPALEGTGYTLKLPDGWSDITKAEQASEPKIDVAGRSDEKGKDYTSNLNVVTTDSKITGTPTRAELNVLANQTRAEILPAVAKPATLQLASLGGSPAVHQEGSAVYGQVPYYLVQYSTIRDGKNYVVTFTFPTGVDSKDRDAVVDPVLASFSFR